MNIEELEKRKIPRAQREAILHVESLVAEGMGLAREADGKVVLLRYALPGETVRAHIYKETTDYALAEPVEILKSHPLRQQPRCAYFGLCGGCDYQMLPYAEQLRVKQDLVRETFARIAKIDLSIHGVIASPQEFHYRNTMHYKVGQKYQDIGFFRRDTRHVVDVRECSIAMPALNEAKEHVRQHAFPPHNFKVRTTSDGDTVVHWVPAAPYEDRSVVETVTVGDRSLAFQISPNSFFQVNNYVIPLWLEKIISFLDPQGNERIFDLYCGIGLITLFVCHYAKETIGVEIAKSSVEDAIANQKRNHIQGSLRFVLGDVQTLLPELGYADVIIVDPPRGGLDTDSVQLLQRMRAKKIIYSSCKASTMARDIAALADDYCMQEMHLVDMFPQTHHIELLALLARKEDSQG